MAIAVVELVVTTAVCFYATARNGVTWQAGIETGVVNGSRVLVPLPPSFRELVEDLTFLKIVQNAKFDSALALFAYRQSSEIDWFEITTEYPWLPYQWATEDIKPILVPDRGSKRRAAPYEIY